MEKPFSVTFSAGVAHFRGGSPPSSKELLALADKALYQAKEEGKNRVVVKRIVEKPEEEPRATMVRSEEKLFLFS